MTLATLCLLAAAAPLLRNPFWPVGYEGRREPITDQPRYAVSTVNGELRAYERRGGTGGAAELSDADQLWASARAQLKITGVLANGDRRAVTINGFAYRPGDVVSVNTNGFRFTWRIREITPEGKLRLKRLRQRELQDQGEFNADEGNS